MISRYFFHIRCYCITHCKTFNNVRYLSNLHSTVSENGITKFLEGHKRKRREQEGNIYVKNAEVANSIASCIAKEWNGGYLLEANAGPGVLSHSLLQNGIQHLRILEKNEEFLPALEILKADYPTVDIVQQDLMMIPSYEYKKEFKQLNVTEFFDSTFKDIPAQTWEKDTSFQIFAVIGNKRSHKFLRYLLAAIANQGTPFSFGRCDFFMLISENEFQGMNALPKENLIMYRWSTVLYKLFFDVKCLKKFSNLSENFYICSRGWNKKRKLATTVYLVKMTPKSDIFTPPMTPEKLQEFFFFVRCNLAKRSDLVIKSIEKWMPFCGPRLIKEGFNVFMKFGDLSPTDIFQLFNSVSSWSEYKNCYSEALACKFYKKKVPEDDTDIELH